MKEIREKYGIPILVFQNVNGDETVYSYELLQKWKNAVVNLIELYRDYESETEAGHFVNRIYVDENGNLWLTRYWIDHFGYTWDELQIYYIEKKDSKKGE
jgi:hypothetical protein